MSAAFIAILLSTAAGAVPAPAPTDATAKRVERVLSAHPIIDGHNDLPWEIRERYDAKVEALDLSRATNDLPLPLQTDIPRLRKGQVGAQFWSVYIPAEVTGPEAVAMTMEEIDIVRRFTAAHPDTFAMATTAADIRRIQKAGKIASLLGIEGGHQIDGRLSILREFKALGVGYMTLTHSKSLAWADSSTDAPRANGLTDFGRQVVAEMNRIGMFVDVSHVSDATMAEALRVTKAPVIASHSSARALSDAPRNIPDDLLRAIGANGGVVMVNFFPSFLSNEWRQWQTARSAYARSVGVPSNAYRTKAPGPLLAWDAAHPEPLVTAATVADHIEHIAKVAGKQHVGMGADLDGIGGTGPQGIKGVDGYPLVFAELAKRGWSDTELADLAQGNLLRAMEKMEAVARSLGDLPPVDATDRR